MQWYAVPIVLKDFFFRPINWIAYKSILDPSESTHTQFWEDNMPRNSPYKKTKKRLPFKFAVLNGVILHSLLPVEYIEFNKNKNSLFSFKTQISKTRKKCNLNIKSTIWGNIICSVQFKMQRFSSMFSSFEIRIKTIFLLDFELRKGNCHLMWHL